MSRDPSPAAPARLARLGAVGLAAVAGLLAAAPAFATFSSATPAPAGLPALVKMMGPSDWGGIAVGTAIVFGILGRKLAKDIQGWLR